MNPALYIVNSIVKIGFFNQNDLNEAHETSGNGFLDFLTMKPIQKIILSAVKQLNPEILTAIQQHCDTLLVMYKLTPLPITVNYKSPETLGVDRLAAAVGSLKYCQTNVLIIDIGTCITYDLLDHNRVFQGGIIAPGINMRLKSMHEFTARLPLAERKNNQGFIGKTTEECMQSGAFNGNC